MRERPLVLVVDDDAASRDVLAEMLSDRYDVVRAGGGAQGVALAQEQAPDLVLMDVAMPRKDGFFALRELLAHPDTRHAPVIFISGAADEDTLVRCLEMGAADFVAKPISPRVLRARIERALRESRERQALQALAQTDALTGLSNFRALSARLDQEFKRAARYGHALSAVMIDLDNLKVVNDRFGHEVGNRAIVAVASHLKDNLREVDFAARYGGDEFIVLLAHQNADEAAVFAERVRGRLCPVSVTGPDGLPLQLALTISVGIAEHGPEQRQGRAELLLEAADLALYEAKRRGRDQIVVFRRRGARGGAHRGSART